MGNAAWKRVREDPLDKKELRRVGSGEVAWRLDMRAGRLVSADGRTAVYLDADASGRLPSGIRVQVELTQSRSSGVMATGRVSVGGRTEEVYVARRKRDVLRRKFDAYE